MQFIRIFFIAVCLLSQFAAEPSRAQSNQRRANTNSLPKFIADSFAYPVGKTEFVTAAKDRKDEWYNAQDFGANNHLGEDWNKNSGGNTDCGEPVFAAGNGKIVFAENAGAGWGNVVIIEHDLPNGKKVQTLYGHLQTISKTSGAVKKREPIGTIGNAGGKYFCHLHFELRAANCPEWNKAGVGYSAKRNGWLDPSDFIDARSKN
ncbi:MAG TPA: M23 family metallopeptidase [Pyrinomonadaceae bacterium]|jgi:murein DD-endopeptidase MepM/ murein hydrolase activator NlpD